MILRPARMEDASALARLHLAARDAIPLPRLHGVAETALFHERLIDRAWVIIAAADENSPPLGYAALADSVLEQFYVAPTALRRGIGAALLHAARRQAGGAVTLWCFAHNARALAFYRRFGAVVIGAEGPEANEEGLPALRLRLPPNSA